MTPGGERTKAALRIGVLFVVIASPLPFGSVEPAAILPLELCCSILGALAVWVGIRDPQSWPRALRSALAAVAVWGLIGLVQIVPLPLGWSAPPAAQARRDLAPLLPEVAAAAAPWSISPTDTVGAVVLLVSYTLLGIAAAVAFDRRRHLRTAAIVIAAGASFQALYGAAEYLSGRQHIFGWAKKFYLDEATGTFINRNHFAGYLAMALPLALALALPARVDSGGGLGWRKRLLAWAGASRAGAVLAVFAVASIWLGIALSYSRTGLAAAVLAAACFLLTSHLTRHKLVLAFLLLAIPIAALTFLEIRAPGERFTALAADSGAASGRAVVWRTTAQLVARQPLLGYGLGTFETAYEPQRSARAPGRYDHAHNDWLELLCDGGVLALGAGIVLALVSIRWLRATMREIPSVGLGLRAAAGAGVLAISFHSLADFCLRIPANAVLLAVLLGLQVPRDRAEDPQVAAFRRSQT